MGFMTIKIHCNISSDIEDNVFNSDILNSFKVTEPSCYIKVKLHQGFYNKRLKKME